MNTNLKLDRLNTKLPEAAVFRHLRISSGLRVRDLASMIQVTHTLICHYESGRQKIPEHRLQQLCRVFKVSPEDLKDFQEGRRPLPINYKDECFLLIHRMSATQLQAVHGLLIGIAGAGQWGTQERREK